MREIPLSRGYVALVDDADYELVMAAGPWHANPGARTVYAQHNRRRKGGGWSSQSLHSFLTGWPRVDHENGNGLDNQRSNLRPATSGQNSANRGANTNNSAAGYKGVQPNRTRGLPWRAQIGAARKKYHLGLFATPEAAARAYDAAARELHGEFARTNFPLETS